MFVFLVLFSLLPPLVIWAGFVLLLPHIADTPAQYWSCYPTLIVALVVEFFVVVGLAVPKIRARLFWLSAAALVLLPLVAVFGLAVWSGNPDYAATWLLLVLPLSGIGALLGVCAMGFVSYRRTSVNRDVA